MKAFLILLLPLFLTTGFSATAGEVEEEVFASFEWFCLSHLNEPETIAPLFAPLKIEPLPKEKADMFLAPLTGQAWFVPGTNTRGFIVSITDKGVCNVYGPDAEGNVAKELFEKHIKNKKLDALDEGSQTTEMYAVSYPVSAGKVRAMVSVQTSKLASVKGATFSALPEKLAVKEGIKIPAWPE